MKTSRIVAAILTILLSLSLIACGGEKKPENSNSVGNNELYDQVMSRFTGELEKGSVVKVLENDTAIELGYVEELIAAFNEAYKDKGISAERMNIDQYSDLATDGPYGYGPDVWYQANDIIMKYANNQHILPLPVNDMVC